MYGRTIFFLFIHFLFSWNSYAEKTTIIADADMMEKNTPKQTLTLKGNVNVIFQQQHLLCDEAVIYEATSTIIASGNVILQNPQTTLRGEKIVLNYDTNTGKLYKGVVTSGQVLIEAAVIEKIGENEYRADDAYYTACLTCPPSWGFTSSRLTAEIDGYAYIERPWLHLLQFPVLPLPYLVVPLNSERQTGLLVPNLSTDNRGGATFQQPFYWAIDRSQDATFTLVSYEKLGIQGLGNYRFVTSETSGGELNTAYMKDRAEPYNYQDRWFIDYQHRFDLPNDYTQRSNLTLASDQNYVLDFPRQLPYLGKPALENSFSLTKAFDQSLFTFDTGYYVSLIDDQPDFDNSNSLHRLPEINYHLLDQRLSDDYDIFFNLDVQYLNVARQGPAFLHTRSGSAECPDTGVCYSPSPSGEFNYGAPAGTNLVDPTAYGDLIRTGQRLDIMPRIHAPFWIGSYFDVDPSFALRYTQYALGVQAFDESEYDPNPFRFYAQFDVSSKSYFSKVFDWSDTLRLKHTVIPEVRLKYIPRVHQSDHNFFGTQDDLTYMREQQPIDNTDADWRNGGRGIQFDNNDRVIGRQLVDFVLTNKILARSLSPAAGESQLASRYSEPLFFSIAQAYDLAEADKGAAGRPWQDIRALLRMNSGPITQYLETRHYPYHGRTEWVASTRYRFLGNNFTQLSYAKRYNITQAPPVSEDSRRENLQLSTGLTFDYVNFYGYLHYDLNPAKKGDHFTHWTSLVNVAPPGSCWSFGFGITQQMITKRLSHQFTMEFTFN